MWQMEISVFSFLALPIYWPLVAIIHFVSWNNKAVVVLFLAVYMTIYEAVGVQLCCVLVYRIFSLFRFSTAYLFFRILVVEKKRVTVLFF